MTYFIRLTHITFAASILCGAVLLFVLFVTWKRRGTPEAATGMLQIMEVYEFVFWFSIGLVVATGIGNLGAFGEALPTPDSSWGQRFTAKLALLAIFLALSLIRTLSLALILMSGIKPSRSELSPLMGMYGGTAALLIGLISLAVGLAYLS